MRRRFLHLVTIMDWASRRVLAWRLSNAMEADFCIEALKEVMTRHGRPEIFNTDQGIQTAPHRFVLSLSSDSIAGPAPQYAGSS